ncbi:MAG TPA: hypothetical protein VGQ83_05965 [Polyangia bacterium]|jgi:hypothetical protein
MRLRIVLLGLVALAGCSGPGLVEFADGQCVIDGAAATQSQVEARQSAVSKRVDSRQPFFILITVIVVAVGAASTVQNAWRVIAANAKAEGKGFGDRVREALERHRQHRVRYVATVGGSLVLLLAAGGAYVYLDLDKRACERLMQTLQYCQLALRSAEEHADLAEQKRNLDAIQATATDIRSVVDRLPPDDQRRARRAVDQLGQALGRQSRTVGVLTQRTEEAARLVRERAPRRGARPAPPAASGKAPAPAVAAAPTVREVQQQVQQLATKLDTVEATLRRVLTACEGTRSPQATR